MLASLGDTPWPPPPCPPELPVVDALSHAEKDSFKSALFRFSESNGEKLTSDKVYGVFISQSEGCGFSVKTLYGGRKASSASGAEKIVGATQEKALAVFEKEPQTRLEKSYQTAQSAQEPRSEVVTLAGAGLPLTAAVAKKFPMILTMGFAALIWPRRLGF